MERKVLIRFLFVLVLILGCNKNKSNYDTPLIQLKKINVKAGLDVYLDENRGKSIWQIYIDFDPSVSNCSGSANIEFIEYKKKKYLMRKFDSFKWNIPSTVSTREYIYTTTWSTKDFDSVSSIQLKSMECDSCTYNFQIK
jgi:hypothetical protein